MAIEAPAFVSFHSAIGSRRPFQYPCPPTPTHPFMTRGPSVALLLGSEVSEERISFFYKVEEKPGNISLGFSLSHFPWLSPRQVSCSARLLSSGRRVLLSTHRGPDVFPEKGWRPPPPLPFSFIIHCARHPEPIGCLSGVRGPSAQHQHPSPRARMCVTQP